MSCFQIVDGCGQFVPGLVESHEELFAFGGQGVVLTWRSLCALLPFVGEQTVLLQSREQGVERTLHHQQLGLLQAANDVAGIGRCALQQEQDAVFEHPLSHLRFRIVDVHDYLLLKPIGSLRGTEPQGDVGQQAAAQAKEGHEEEYTHEERVDLEVLGKTAAYTGNLLVRLRQVETLVVHSYYTL